MKSCQAPQCFCTDFNRRLCKEYREPKKAPKILQKFSIRKKKLSELEFFKSEWDKRGGRCFLTGEKIPFHPASCFHVLGKGAFPKYRLKPENLIFMKIELHNDWHALGQNKCLEKDARWKMIIDLYEKLKIEYFAKT